ncbi:hypothetical protein [Nocardioides alkalitolerans]|uniref:hypothetical protein n=1 Tax=Nocardioides alkalitolerans TaxID=281714 RepID=UPI0003FD2CE8|nr:hypothetical protein [Nocardioides alkalitolerans]
MPDQPADVPPADEHRPPADAVKVVVWDLDGTTWDDVAVELPDGARPEPRPDVLAAARTLAAHGVVSSVASRTDPAVAALLTDPPTPALAALADLVVAPRLGWQDKSVMLAAIADELGVAVGSLLLVDDSGFERAEVAARLPAAGTTTRAALLADLAAPHPTVLPARTSTESADRTRRYQAEARRREAAASYADRDAFLAACDLRLTVRPATPADRDRVVELVARAHRLASTRVELDPASYDAWLAAGDRRVVVAGLVDRFGDHGTIGVALLAEGDGATTVEGLAVSCRVAGRGVPGAFVTTLRHHVTGGALALPIRVTSANVELRMLVRSLGGTLEVLGPDEVVGRFAPGPPPPPPDWLHVDDRLAPQETP